jgi:tetratricopeptide (TPR) repeat protein
MSLSRYLRSALFVLSTLPAAIPAAGQQAGPRLSPAEARIAAAQARLKTSPQSFAAYNDLAAALCRKGRDTEDVAVYEQADAAVNHSLELSTANYDARKLKVVVLLGKREFVPALQLATELNHKVPDDLAGWAALADINIALGNYAEAERQTQWVLDLRPGNTLGFEKAAALRVLFGDLPGAIDFLDEANRRTSPNDADQRAWLLTRKAALQLAAGYDKEADELLQQALQLFPDSQRAIEVQARVRWSQGKFSDAIALLEKRCERVLSARNLYDWAEALEKSGQKIPAEAAFNRFKTQAALEAARPFNANLELVFFNLNQRKDPAAALALAAQMAKERRDCGTLDAYAWALYNNGKSSDAKVQMDRALAVGVRDPLYFCHAAQIAARIGDAAAAANYQKEAASFKGGSCSAGRTSVLVSGVTR